MQRVSLKYSNYLVKFPNLDYQDFDRYKELFKLLFGAGNKYAENNVPLLQR